MPITLASLRLNRSPGGVSLYRQLEDTLTSAIDTGQLAPGEELPSDADFRSVLGISDGTVRKAMDGLRRHGLIDRRSGAPTRVREQQPVRRVTTNRYAKWLEILMQGADVPQASAFTDDYGIDWEAFRLDATFTEGEANPSEAKRLDLPAGSRVLRRSFVKFADGKPQQMQDSVLPWDIVAGTPVADPANQPWPGGTEGELFALGYAVEREEEDIRARPARDEEIEQLALDDDDTVFEAVRTFYSEGRPVETSLVVMSAATNVLHFATDLSAVLARMTPEMAKELEGRRNANRRQRRR